MNIIWLYSLLSVFIVSLMGFAGALTLPFREATLKKLILFMVSFAAGALLGDAFIHLIPEAFAKTSAPLFISLNLSAGIIVFFILEKLIGWRHCHNPDHLHTFAFMNMIGDAFHNSIDGMIIAGSFLASPALGLTTSIAVVLHEIPQEIGDYGVLLHGGFGRIRALFLCFLVQLTSILGALLILILSIKTEVLANVLVPFTAGGFIYIAGSDLIPELHKENDFWGSIFQLFSLCLGIGLMLLLLRID